MKNANPNHFVAEIKIMSAKFSLSEDDCERFLACRPELRTDTLRDILSAKFVEPESITGFDTTEVYGHIGVAYAQKRENELRQIQYVNSVDENV